MSNPEKSGSTVDIEQSKQESQEVVAEDMRDALKSVDDLSSATVPANHEDIQRLINDLNALVEKLQAMSPEYSPPAYSPKQLKTRLDEYLQAYAPDIDLPFVNRLRTTVREDVFDPDTWKGLWYMLNYYLEYQGDFVRRRIRGEYETDEWGLDPEFVDLVKPIFGFLYKYYFRVETTGLHNLPGEGCGLLVANHSGQIPLDATMIGYAVMTDHPSNRMPRALYANWFTRLPFFSSVLVKLGQALANEENGIRLLEQGELVQVFPEGIKGISKLYKDRYKLARFGRGGFVRMALKTGAPIIPISVVGAEETYITLRQARFITNLIGFPFFPISLRWPWLGPLGLVPLPTKWYLDFGSPIRLDDYPSGSAEDLMLISQLSNQVRNQIQKMIYDRLATRQSVFFG